MTAAVFSQLLVQQMDVCCGSVEGKPVARKSEATVLLLVTRLHGGRKSSSCAAMIAERSVCLNQRQGLIHFGLLFLVQRAQL